MSIGKLNLTAPGKTLVQTAAGDAVVFSGLVSQFTVRRPKVALLVAAVISALVGHFI